ncbi:MAG: HAMP domain-containing histidine kinase [Chloroflexota bacterium]|nr:HAMP domain-containing histidine kinase [Chloroflexota bacterium]
MIGLQALQGANARADELAQLQRKTAAYRDLRQTTSDELSAVASALASGSPAELDTAARQVNLAVFDVDRLEFVAANERDQVAQIREAHVSFAASLKAAIDLARAGRSDEARARYAADARPLADRLDRRTNELVHKAEAEMFDASQASAAAYDASQVTVIGAAIGSLALAILLGSALALSVVRPLRAIDDRLGGIAAGDFTKHVAVANRDELGSLGRHLNAMNDELGRLYGEVEAANRNKSIFLANMSHELRTPLNAIIGFSEVLLQQMFGPLNERQQEYTRDVLVSGHHLLGLINDVLDLSKVEAGKMELEPARMAVAPLIDGSVMMIRERAAKHAIVIAVNIDPNVGEIDADERKLRQVLFNLLSNAEKFTPESGRIDVGATRTDGEVRISVKDSGIGIAVADQARIFEKFVQAESGRRQEASTGLGLALAKSLVELHGGRLWVESSPGLGSTFTFSVPDRAAA